jgi:hypothetical protein
LGDMRNEKLKQDEKEEEERQMNIISLKLEERRQLLDLSKKEVENIKFKIPYYKNLFEEAFCINNRIADYTKSNLRCCKKTN